jgi:hepatocyte nuclear factor 4
LSAAEIEIYRIGIRIMDEIVKPLRDIQMDDTEYTCLKAIVFFDPSKWLPVAWICSR